MRALALYQREMDQQLRIADVFCGIGSFHIAGEELGMRCVWACDNDVHAKRVYSLNYGIMPDDDIKKIDLLTIPDHDIMCAGFPCQPFSRMGNKRGSNEDRGRIVDYAIDILALKRPRAAVFENVRGFLSSNGGEDFKRFQSMVQAAGYSVQHQMLKCEDFGIPQTRHRVFIVCLRDGYPEGFKFPLPMTGCPTLSEYLGLNFVKRMSNTVRCSGRKSGVDNGKNWSAYRLQDGSVIEYTLDQVTRLQGFPPDFQWGTTPDSQRWRCLGNTIPTCLSRVILQSVKDHLLAHPEKPAKTITLPLATSHLPPARVIIEQRLQQCEQQALAMRPRADDASAHEEDSPSDCGDSDGTESQATAELAEVTVDEKPPAPKLRRTDQLQQQQQQFVQLTVKSDTQLTLTLPDNVLMQTYMLHVVK